METTAGDDQTTTEAQSTTTEVPESTTTPAETTTASNGLTTTDSASETTTNLPDTTTEPIDSTTTEGGDQTTGMVTTTESSGSSTTTQAGMDGNQTTPCPLGQLEGDQIALVCPTGFRRHPKYCNLFYQCTSNPETYEMKVLVLSCPNGTIYDDQKIQCLTPEETNQQCTGEIAEKRSFRRSSGIELSPVSLNVLFL